MGKVWYVDSSVILRALINDSVAAQAWFQTCQINGDEFYGSRMVELEVRRVVHNAGASQNKAGEYLDAMHLVAVTEQLIDDAIGLTPPLGAADSLHVATAQLLAPLGIVVATHDAQMASAIRVLGTLSVHDPVTDDPRRPAVT